MNRYIFDLEQPVRPLPVLKSEHKKRVSVDLQSRGFDYFIRLYKSFNRKGYKFERGPLNGYAWMFFGFCLAAARTASKQSRRRVAVEPVYTKSPG